MRHGVTEKTVPNESYRRRKYIIEVIRLVSILPTRAHKPGSPKYDNWQYNAAGNVTVYVAKPRDIPKTIINKRLNPRLHRFFYERARFDFQKHHI